MPQTRLQQFSQGQPAKHENGAPRHADWGHFAGVQHMLKPQAGLVPSPHWHGMEAHPHNATGTHANPSAHGAPLPSIPALSTGHAWDARANENTHDAGGVSNGAAEGGGLGMEELLNGDRNR